METALQVKNVDFYGDTLLAGQDNKGKIWAGAPDECKGIEMFFDFPTHNQILWSIKKHDGDIAKIEKIYKKQEEIPF